MAKRIHGDFQIDNVIIANENSSFRLIDFRQDFAGNMVLGDLYYDLGKLLASLLIDYEALAMPNGSAAIHPMPGAADLIAVLEEFCIQENLEIAHVYEMALLVHVNMLGVHDMVVAMRLAESIVETASAACAASL